MQETKVSRRYAKSLLDLSVEKKQPERKRKGYDSVAGSLQKQQGFQAIAEKPARAIG